MRLANTTIGPPSHYLHFPPQNPNVVHYAMLLDAEFADLKGKVIKAEKNFESAILRAEKRNQLNDAAKGEQRYGEFLLRHKKVKQASIHLQRAADLFDSWGAYLVLSWAVNL